MPDRKLPADLAREAKANPNGWVYEIDGAFRPEDGVPPEAIIGAWKVDGDGNIVGELIPNPNYRPAATRAKP